MKPLLILCTGILFLITTIGNGFSHQTLVYKSSIIICKQKVIMPSQIVISETALEYEKFVLELQDICVIDKVTTTPNVFDPVVLDNEDVANGTYHTFFECISMTRLGANVYISNDIVGKTIIGFCTPQQKSIIDKNISKHLNKKLQKSS